MKPLGFFDRRVRGFRVVELGAAGFLLILVLVVYMAKTGAGGKRADIDHAQQQIDAELSQIRMLRAEVATLEQPERLEALSARYLNLQPIPAKHEVAPEALADAVRLDGNPSTASGKPAATAGAPVENKFVLASATTTTSPALAAPTQTPVAASGSNKPHPSRPASASLDAVIDSVQSSTDSAPEEQH